MDLSFPAFAAGLLSGTATGAVVGWFRNLAPPLVLAVLLGVVCAVGAALAARGSLGGSRRQAAFFLAASVALPVGLLV